MKILISSHAFAPSIGGIETVSALLAEEFVRLGNEVTLVTQKSGESEPALPYRVVRTPSLGELHRALRWCDIFWQNNLSVRTLWPALLQRIPIVVTHQGSYCRLPSGPDLALRLKRAVAERTTSVAISQAIAASFAGPSTIIPNPFDARLFAPGPSTGQRPNELVFLGRLVTEKGVDLLLEALAPTSACLTIVGDGPERSNLEEMSQRLGLSARVHFAGPARGPELLGRLQEHQIMVVPSRYDEPFGVVALEGIAAGCVVIGSSGGGLGEAIGSCGLTFPNADVAALRALIERLLGAPEECARLQAHAPEHLARFHPNTIALQYLELFRAEVGK